MTEQQHELHPDIVNEWGDILPGTVFWQTVDSPQNQQLLDNIKHARKLDAPELKLIQRRIKRYQFALATYEYQYHEKRLAAFKSKILSLKKDNPSDERIATMIDRYQDMKSNPPTAPANLSWFQRLFSEKPVVITNERDARKARLWLDKADKRLLEHKTALANQKIYDDLAQEMKLEAGYFGQQLIKRWTSLKLRDEWYDPKKKRANYHRVKIKEAFVTPDEIQYKILVYTRGILGTVKHHLPDGVTGWSLVKPDTLSELSMACERPVSTPHYENTPESFENGLWLTVYREGLTDGLFDVVDYLKVMSKYDADERNNYPVPVGVKRGRVVEWLWLAEQPHLMINGISGSGKTNWIRVLIATLISYHSPDEMRLFIVDLKRGGDFRSFADVPHMADSIITRLDQLSELAPRLVAIMHERMDIFARKYLHDIDDYNANCDEQDERMPHITVIIDECGAINDLADDKKQRDVVWRSLTLIATQARAAGIHLCLGTQQSFSDSIPKSVRDNITFVLSGRQRTLAGSLATFGTGKAKTLPAIRGRMYCDDGTGEPFQVQTPFLSKELIAKSVATAMNYKTTPLAMPVVTSTDDTLAEKRLTIDDVIEIAITQFDGIMSQHKIHAVDGMTAPRSEIANFITRIVSMGTVTYADDEYIVKRYGKGYQLVRNTETHNYVIDTSRISNSIDTVFQEN